MELKELVREALEVQVIEDDVGGAALLLEKGVRENGATEVSRILLDSASIVLRRMVADTGEAFDEAELLSQMALNGVVPDQELELLMETLAFAAATAGGIRPPQAALQSRVGDEKFMLGAWLTLITAIFLVSVSLQATEAELVEELGAELTHY